jgi:hypothetical protein
VTHRLLGLAAGLALAGSVLATPASAAPRPGNAYAAACRAAPEVVNDRPAAGPVLVAAPSALPPTPLTILADGGVTTAVTARVVSVLYQGPKPSVPRRPNNFVGPIPPQRCQVVRLNVVHVVAGTPPAPLVVVKPRAPYTLRASRSTHAGTFLLDHATPYPKILGNYGPDPYDPSAVATVLAAASRG